MTDLKPCAHCGSSDAPAVVRSDLFHEGYYTAMCIEDAGGCGAMTRHFETEEEAAEAWNRREEPRPATPPAPPVIVRKVVAEGPGTLIRLTTMSPHTTRRCLMRVWDAPPDQEDGRQLLLHFHVGAVSDEILNMHFLHSLVLEHQEGVTFVALITNAKGETVEVRG